jgi:hypothetical protein
MWRTGLPLALLALSGALHGEDEPEYDRDTRVVATNLVLDAAIITYGFIAWDYGSSAFHGEAENWFGADTLHGGADKLGHAYTTYALTSGLSTVYRHWGYDEAPAAALGAASALGAVTIMEIGDGISSVHGFSYEDEVMNVVGAGIGLARQTWRPLRRLIDYRLEYIPSPLIRHGEADDITTDYSGMKYVLALKASGFAAAPKWLRLIELQVGYYSRGYEDDDHEFFDEAKRTGYIAIGLNVAELASWFTGHPGTHFFNYYQAPYTYAPLEHDY